MSDEAALLRFKREQLEEEINDAFRRKEEALEEMKGGPAIEHYGAPVPASRSAYHKAERDIKRLEMLVRLYGCGGAGGRE